MKGILRVKSLSDVMTINVWVKSNISHDSCTTEYWNIQVKQVNNTMAADALSLCHQATEQP